MTENSRIKTDKSEEGDNLPVFVFTEFSRGLLQSIEDMLGELINQAYLSPSDDEFYNKFRKILDLYDLFQNEIADSSDINVVCSAGCSNCCCHWADDVNSFEGLVISRYLAAHHPEKIDQILKAFLKDAEVLDSLVDIVNEKISAYSGDDIPEAYDLLLSCFYQLERPCALLDDNGKCIVYPVRPFTCRDYLNLKDPAACLPERINEEKYATIITDFSDVITERLEILHRRFDNCSGDMSLRTLLVSCLKSVN